MGTDLHDRVHAQFRQSLDAGTKGDWRAHLARPIGRVQQFVRIDGPSAEIADEGERRRREGELGEGRLEVVHRRLDHGAVVGGAPAQSRHPNLGCFQTLDHRSDFRRRAADDLVRPVVGGDANADALRGRIVFVKRLLDPVDRCEHRRHRAFPRQCADQRAPHRGEAQSVLKAEHPCSLRCCDLPQTVSDHHVGPDAEARPQGGEGALQGIDGWLLPLRIVQVTGGTRPAEHQVEQRGATFFVEHGFTPVEHSAHHRLALIQRRAHARPLAGLPGVGERHGRCPARCGLLFRLSDCP